MASIIQRRLEKEEWYALVVQLLGERLVEAETKKQEEIKTRRKVVPMQVHSLK